MKKLLLFFGALFSFATNAGYPGDNPLITADDLLSKLQSDKSVVVLDVRTLDEYNEGHVPSAINIPYDDIEDEIAAKISNKAQQIVVYCRSGYRASKAEATLEELGYRNILHLKGDMLGWKANKKPLEKSK